MMDTKYKYSSCKQLNLAHYVGLLISRRVRTRARLSWQQWREMYTISARILWGSYWDAITTSKWSARGRSLTHPQTGREESRETQLLWLMMPWLFMLPGYQLPYYILAVEGLPAFSPWGWISMTCFISMFLEWFANTWFMFLFNTYKVKDLLSGSERDGTHSCVLHIQKVADTAESFKRFGQIWSNFRLNDTLWSSD